MPRNVRNAWVDLDVDGRESSISTGPRNGEGGMTARFYIREKGSVAEVLSVRFYRNQDTVELVVEDTRTHKIIHKLEVPR